MEKSVSELRIMAKQQQEIIGQEIKIILDTYFQKPFELESRIKSEMGLLRKLRRFPNCYGDDISKIEDILGFRISTPYTADCPLIAQLIENHFNPERLKDYFNTTNEVGFQAYLYYLTDRSINVEVQIMTHVMRDWTNSTHAEHELRKYGTVLTQNNKTK